ncbi:MFS transporter [Amycolatopsis jejuensis]|uniref:MFS transporter n=1 Tax=Amycolatopsis jejuensis TaxID=330084 RepID=UPI00068BE119|nr:MFS transporter [Amycolatopsis jejuensis]
MSARRRPGFAEPLRNSEFRALWLAELISVVGDQLARVALALVVYAQTSSAFLTALTYGLTLVPSLLGGMLLSGLADRFSRRGVMIVADIARALFAVAMAVPGLPLPVLWASVGLLSFAAGPFKAAQMSLLPEVLGRGERYEAGLALRQFTTQLAQLAGFAGGGLLLAWLEPHVAMGLNAGTFVVSTVLVLLGVRRRPAARGATQPAASGDGRGAGGNRGLVGVLFGMVLLLGLYIVPEGLAAPYGHQVGAGAVGVGLLLAADPVGSAVGAWASTRISLPTRLPTVVASAVLAGLPLAICAARPGLALTLMLWALSGAMAQVFLIKTQALVVAVVPNHRLGGVMGRMGTVMYCSQGLMIVAGGAVADRLGPFRATAAAGAVAAGAALVVGAGWWVARSRGATGSEPNSVEQDLDHHSLPCTSGTSPRDQDRRTSRVARFDTAPTRPATHGSQYGR